jgi:site-specific DNA recombinase
MKRKTVAYLRVSTLKQKEEETIETQRYVLSEYVAHHKIKLDAAYEDDGVSGGIEVHLRPGGSRLYRAISAGEIDMVLLFHSDRVGRDTIDTLLFHRHAANSNVRLVGIADNTDSFREGSELTTEIKAVIAAEYRRDVVRRTRAGLRRRAESGRVSSPPPYGYVVDGDGRLEMDEGKAANVTRIFTWYADGAGPKEIVRRLTEMGATSPRGKGWRHDTLIYLLRQRAYAGEYVYFRTPKKSPGGGARIPRSQAELLVKECPAIITRELFDRVQAKIIENKTSGPASTKRNYLLRRLIRCSKCENNLVYVGHAVSGRTFEKKDGTVTKYPDFLYYECASLTNRDYEFCGSARVDARDIEGKVWADIEGFLRRPSELINKLFKRYQQQSEDGLGLARRKDKIRKALSDNDAAYKRIVDAIGKGTVNESRAQSSLNELDAERNELEAELARVESEAAHSKAFKSRISNAREMLKALSRRLDRGLDEDDRAELIRLLVENIKITTVIDEKGRKRPHATVTYLFPSQEDTDFFSSEVSGFSDSSLKK